jgi:hypothetical protein
MNIFAFETRHLEFIYLTGNPYILISQNKPIRISRLWASVETKIDRPLRQAFPPLSPLRPRVFPPLLPPPLIKRRQRRLTWGNVGRTLEKRVKHSATPRVLHASVVFSQHSSRALSHHKRTRLVFYFLTIALCELGWEPLETERTKAKVKMVYKVLKCEKTFKTNYYLRDISTGLCLPKPVLITWKIVSYIYFQKN